MDNITLIAVFIDTFSLEFTGATPKYNGFLEYTLQNLLFISPKSFLLLARILLTLQFLISRISKYFPLFSSIFVQ